VHRVSRVALFGFALPLLLPAQSTDASLTGRVTDPSNALVADAKIAAINAATNIRYESTTNAAGEYGLANLPPGAYGIEIEKRGFKKLVKPDVTLHVQDALGIDFEMALGDAAVTVTVEAGARVVNSESGTVSTVIDREGVENLPLNGRSFQTLIMLTPGVVVTATAFDDQGQFSVNGQRGRELLHRGRGQRQFRCHGLRRHGPDRIRGAACSQLFRGNQQPGVGGRDAGVPYSDVFVCSGVRPHPRRASFHRDAFRNLRLSRHAVRILPQCRSGCQGLVRERQRPGEVRGTAERFRRRVGRSDPQEQNVLLFLVRLRLRADRLRRSTSWGRNIQRRELRSFPARM